MVDPVEHSRLVVVLMVVSKAIDLAPHIGWLMKLALLDVESYMIVQVVGRTHQEPSDSWCLCHTCLVEWMCRTAKEQIKWWLILKLFHSPVRQVNNLKDELERMLFGESRGWNSSSRQETSIRSIMARKHSFFCCIRVRLESTSDTSWAVKLLILSGGDENAAVKWIEKVTESLKRVLFGVKSNRS